MKSAAINISLELELRRDRICPWCTEADIISTGCIPVVFIKEIVAPRRKCHRLPSEMGIPRNPQIHQRLSANRNRSAFTIIAICISDQCSAGIGQTSCHLKRICRLVHQRQVSRPLRHRIYAPAVIQAILRLCLFGIQIGNTGDIAQLSACISRYRILDTTISLFPIQFIRFSAISIRYCDAIGFFDLEEA